MAHAATTGISQNLLNIAQSCSESAIYLMGLSFIIGSLFTILILLILDFIRRNSDREIAGS
jgi:disulfide bond formation protein DsbB